MGLPRKSLGENSGTAEELRQPGVPQILPEARRVGAEPHGLKVSAGG